MQQLVHEGEGRPSNVVVVGYLFMKCLPMLISAGAIYLEYDLFLLGVTGEASLSIESDTVQGQLINAAPGLFFAVGGLIALVVSIVKGVKISIDGGNKQFFGGPSG